MIDTTNAPEGHWAKPEVHGCYGCAFERANDTCVNRQCESTARPDGSNVIFVEAPQAFAITADAFLELTK